EVDVESGPVAFLVRNAEAAEPDMRAAIEHAARLDRVEGLSRARRNAERQRDRTGDRRKTTLHDKSSPDLLALINPQVWVAPSRCGSKVPGLFSGFAEMLAAFRFIRKAGCETLTWRMSLSENR